MSAELDAPRAAALRLLTHRLRSVAELRRRLLEQGHPADAVETVLRRLEDLGLLDDHAFAVAYVRDGLNLKGRGRRRLARELAAHGIAESVSEQVLDAECGAEAEAALAESLAAKKAAQLKGFPPETARRRLQAYLLRRGIDPELVRRLCDEQRDP